MEHDYEMNIESFASSIIELEEDFHLSQKDSKETDTENKALISLATPTYYRSKAFSTTVGINNLINAADPLLTLATKLRKITIPPDITVLHKNLCHEIKAFENKAQTLGYQPSLILAAKYVICALLDELIPLTLWPDLEWKKFSLINYFYKDLWGDDRFFLILERSLQDVAGNIDLLELLYLCLRLGYEGKYRGIGRGHLDLINLTDHVYNLISQYRDEFSRSLLISLDNPSTHHLIRKKKYIHLLPPIWLTSTFMIASLLIVFIFLHMKLLEMASPISQFLNTLQPIQESNNVSSIKTI
jgi:type VI secretion system protein ImpK